MRNLGDLPGGAVRSVANDVNADGTYVVGRGATSFGFEAFSWPLPAAWWVWATCRWERRPARPLPLTTTRSTRRWDTATARTAPKPSHWRKVQAGWQIRAFGDLPGGIAFSVARGFARRGVNGSFVAVGQSNSTNGYEAFLYSFNANASAGTTTGLGDLPGGTFASEANALHDDGASPWIVGWGTSANGTEAFLWTQADGMQPWEISSAAHSTATPYPSTAPSRAPKWSWAPPPPTSASAPFIWTAGAACSTSSRSSPRAGWTERSGAGSSRPLTT